MNITPAILPHTFDEIPEKLSRVEGITQKVQIDLCDGVFGREKTWLPAGTETLPQGFSYEFDIMVNDWRIYLPRVIELGASRVVLHVDTFTEKDMKDAIAMISPKQLPLGISVSNDKSVDFHAEMIRKALALYPHVYIQVMGIVKIGEQGQFFDDTAPARVIALKQLFGNYEIQVDGGITLDSAKVVLASGADTIVVGSYIFGGEDAGGAIERLSLIN